MAPTSAARAVEVAPALRVVHAVPPERNGGGGVERVAVQRGMQREANAGNTERGRAGQRGQCEGECAERHGCCRGRAKRAAWRFGARRGGEGGEASAGEGPRGAGRPWGGGMVTGGDADAQRQLTMAGGAYGLGSSGPGRRWGRGVPSKHRHKRGATAGEGRWAAVGTCQHALGDDVRAVGRPK